MRNSSSPADGPPSSWWSGTPTTARRAALIQQIGDIERRADKITHETVQLLHSTFITPFDRNDIHRLISGMDDILDLIQDSAESMHLFDIQTLPPESLRMAELLDACCGKVQEAVGLLLVHGQRAARAGARPGNRRPGERGRRA